MLVETTQLLNATSRRAAQVAGRLSRVLDVPQHVAEHSERRAELVEGRRARAPLSGGRATKPGHPTLFDEAGFDGDEPTYGGARVEMVPAPRAPQVPRTLREEWAEFLTENPHVFALFERFALEAIAAGARLGSKAIVERMRWETAVVTRGDTFKLNNNWTAALAREFVERHPEHDGFFELRRSGMDDE